MTINYANKLNPVQPIKSNTKRLLQNSKTNSKTKFKTKLFTIACSTITVAALFYSFIDATLSQSHTMRQQNVKVQQYSIHNYIHNYIHRRKQIKKSMLTTATTLTTKTNSPVLKINQWNHYKDIIEKTKQETGTDFVMLVNNAGCMMYVSTNDNDFFVYDVVTGRMQNKTPSQLTYVTYIIFDPVWYPPKKDWAKGKTATPPGPDNPLGPVKIKTKIPEILIHGNNYYPFSPRHRSHGCIRMRNNDVIFLAKKTKQHIKNGGKVAVDMVYEPVVLSVFKINDKPYLMIKIYSNLYGEKVNYSKKIKEQLTTALGQNCDPKILLNKKRLRPGTYLYEICGDNNGHIMLKEQDYAPLYAFWSNDTLHVYVQTGMSFTDKEKLFKKALGKKYSKILENAVIYQSGRYDIIFSDRKAVVETLFTNPSVIFIPELSETKIINVASGASF